MTDLSNYPIFAAFRYILSGSDEMNIRLWKARASEKLGIMKDREKTAFDYAEKLKEKYAHHPQVRAVIIGFCDQYYYWILPLNAYWD